MLSGKKKKKNADKFHPSLDSTKKEERRGERRLVPNRTGNCLSFTRVSSFSSFSRPCGQRANVVSRFRRRFVIIKAAVFLT